MSGFGGSGFGGGGSAASGFGGPAGDGSTGGAGFGSSAPETKPASSGFGATGGGFGGSSDGGTGFGAPNAGGASFGAPSAGGTGFGAPGGGGAGFGGPNKGSGGGAGFEGSSGGGAGFGGASSRGGATGGGAGFGGASSGGATAGGSGFGGASGGATGGGFGGASSGGGGAFGGGGFGGASGGGGGGFGGASGGSAFGEAGGVGSAGFGGGTGFGGASGGGGASTGFGGGGGGASFGGGEQRSRGCFNCGEDGHRSSDCPQPKKERSSGCFNCGEEGHRSSDCPQPKKERSSNCFNCGEEGHRSSDCPQPKKERSNNCFNCGQEGHRSNECDQPRKERNENCFNCQQPGHRSSECPNPRVEDPDRKPASTHQPEEVVATDLYKEHIEQGSMFEQFFDQQVEITQSGKKPKVDITPVESFESIGLGETMLTNVKQSGYTKPTPIQKNAIPIIMGGHDLMACSQTGSGKTAAFLLPIMAKLVQDGNYSNASESVCSPRVLIIAPTRELAIQIYKEAIKFSNGTICRVEILYGGTSVSYQKSRISKGATVLVGTTGRVNHFINEGLISLREVRYLVLDEADRMLDMGFSDDVNQICKVNPEMKPKEERQTLMFSATFPQDVQALAKDLMKEDYFMIVVDKIGAANKCITQEFIQISRSEKKMKLLETLGIDLEKYETDKEASVFKKKTLVFVASKKMADMLGVNINEAGLPCTTIHGDREQAQRELALSDFRKGVTPVLIATAVAERGLDISGVDHVINYDMPDDLDQYIHRIGRTGRVGNAGRATSFLSEENSAIIPQLLPMLAQADQIVPDWMQEQASSGGGGGFGEGESEWGGAGPVVPNDDAGW